MIRHSEPQIFECADSAQERPKSEALSTPLAETCQDVLVLSAMVSPWYGLDLVASDFLGSRAATGAFSMADSQTYRGRLGQTSKTTVLVTGFDGVLFPAEIYTSVNVKQNQELHQALVGGTLHQIAVPGSADLVDLAVPVIVHDEDRELFALVLPQSLRHEACSRRAKLLESLDAEAVVTPPYVSNFQVAFGGAGWLELVDAQSRSTAADSATSRGQTRVVAESEMDRQWLEIQRSQDEIALVRQQLDEVRERIDRERGQLDTAQEKMEQDRSSLDGLRTELENDRQSWQLEKLTVEAKKLHSRFDDDADEATQVVTDDQLVEIQEHRATEVGSDVIVDLSGEMHIGESEILAVSPRASVACAPDEVRIEPKGLTDFPNYWESYESSDQGPVVRHTAAGIEAAACLPKERIANLFEKETHLFVQLHRMETYPILALTLAGMEGGQAIDSVGWPLDIQSADDRKVIDALTQELQFDIVLYDSDGTASKAVHVSGPLEANLAWALQRVEESPVNDDADYQTARAAFLDADFERVGSMRHTFQRGAFGDATTPSKIKLAVGIVGYWSSEELVEYLIANRSFPLRDFQQIQHGLLQKALDFGIHLNPSLCDVAIEHGLADDERILVERQIANFAEVSISIKNNDLDPIDEYENWEALLGRAADVGYTPDSDVINLFDRSVERAQQFQELRDSDSTAVNPDQIDDDLENPLPSSNTLVEAGLAFDPQRVQSRHSESTNITYFIYDEEIIDSFEDLTKLGRDDLERLLEDSNGRLAAAQMLIERYGASAVPSILATSETMIAGEIEALGSFLETKANGLEGEMARVLESGGPTAIYLSSRVLSSLKSTSALPALLKALRDPARSEFRSRMIREIGRYGSKLSHIVSQSIRREGTDDALLGLLVEMETNRPGTLSRMAKDRSKKLREAARLARELIE
jgi:hypothetical protein